MAFGTNDTLNFCIMTTANYITKALVMYDSLMKKCNNKISFFYFTFDDITYEYLKKLNYKNIVPVAIHELEKFYPELKSTISTRSKGEYFFTCTPHIMDYVLKNYDVDHITYLDADLYFYQDPRIILNELQDNSVLITEHRRHNPTEKDLLTGKYCVQFIPVKNNETGNNVINWWKKKCIEWCYYRYENGKFADQGYLNDWPELFESIKVMDHRGGGVARWNIGYYSFYTENDSIKAFTTEINNNVDLLFYHFEGLKIYSNKIMSAGFLKNDKNIFEFIYKDYIDKLSKKENELIKKLGISRSKLEYEHFDLNIFRFLISELRKLIYPRKRDRAYFYKHLNNYKWLP